MFFGSLIGVELEMISPPLCIMIAMTTILSGTTTILIKEYRKRIKKERQNAIKMIEAGIIIDPKEPRKSRL